MIDELVDLILENDPANNEDERKETKESIEEALRNGRFQCINNVGFFTWQEVRKNGKLYVFIENLYIKPEARNKKNLLYLRDFFRDKYLGKAEFVYWNSTKRNRYFYAKK